MAAALSCSKDDDPKVINVEFDLTGAQAILLSEEGTTVDGGTSATESYLFKIASDGSIAPVVEGAKVVFARTISSGVFLTIDDPGSENLRNFYVNMDNTYTEIDENIGTFMGENENGDLIFQDVSVFRKSTLKIEKIQTTLSDPRVQSLSGNLAVIHDNSIYQIYNTVTNVRYNIAGCNGPRMISFSGSDMALVDDCSNKILINMSTGERSEANITSWNHEAIRAGDKIAVLSGGLIGEPGYRIGLVDETGGVDVISGYEFEPGSGSCMNCGYPNSVLFYSAGHFVVRELTKVTAIKNGESTALPILTGYNVTSISMDGNLVYYLAEDNTGTPLTGVYDLVNQTNETLLNQKFDAVQTFN